MPRSQLSILPALFVTAGCLAPALAFATPAEPPPVTESGERGVGVEDSDFEELDESIADAETGGDAEDMPFDRVDLSDFF